MSDLNMRKTKIRMLSSSCMRKETCKRKLCHLRLHGRPPDDRSEGTYCASASVTATIIHFL